MLSQLLLLLAVAAASNLSISQAYADSTVKGSGVYRSEQGCLRILPAFARRIESMGLTLTKPLECVELQGEIDAYAPTFEAVTDHAMIAETALAAPLQDEPSCKASLAALLHVVADTNERVVESACVPMSVSDYDQGELVIGQYQPMVILLKTPATTAKPVTRETASAGQKLLR